MQVQVLKSNELREGNFVVFNTNNKPFQITQEGLLELSQIQGKPNPYFYEPIQLTEEWLLKLDFSRHHTDYFNDTLIIKNVVDWNTGIPNNKDFVFCVYPNELGSAIVVKNSVLISYVHQLQNLFFALTGRELSLVA